MKNIALAMGAVVVAFLIILFFFTDLLAPRDARTPSGNDENLTSYEHPAGLFSFRYADGYVAVPQEEGEGTGVALYDRAEWEEFSNATEPREGPTAITVSVYENPDELPFQVWLRESPQSNFTLGTEEFTSVVMEDGVGIRYQWSGLYEGESVALFDGGDVYLLSVTYFTREDQKVADFATVVETFRIASREHVSAALDETASALDVSITPLEVLEDSRCPANANCIQAGTVRLRATLTSGLGTAEQVFTLGEPITTEAEEILLIEVTPQTVVGETITPAEYAFHFRISKR